MNINSLPVISSSTKQVVIILTFFLLLMANVYLYSRSNINTNNYIPAGQDGDYHKLIRDHTHNAYKNQTVGEHLEELYKDTVSSVRKMYENTKKTKSQIKLIQSCEQLPNNKKQTRLCSMVNFMMQGTPKDPKRGFVIGQMVTCTHRATTTLGKTVETLRGQLDKLIIYFNDGSPSKYRMEPCTCLGIHDDVFKGTLPDILSEPWIFIARSSDNSFAGNLGDRGKFYPSEYGPESYRIVVDDDINYPKDYISRVVEALDRFDLQATVTIHCSWIKQDANSIYDHVDRNHRHFAHQRKRGTFPDFVNYAGTGAASYHTSTISLSINDFALPNMADIFFSVVCQRQMVPIFCMDRNNNWLRTVPDPDVGKQDLWTYVNKANSLLESLSSYLIKIHRPWKIYRPVINGKTLKEGIW